MLGELTLPASAVDNMGHFDLLPSSFSFLKSLFKSFDRVKWHKLNLYYKPAVGTTYGGLVSLGMDWDFASRDVSRSTMSGFTPNASFAAWSDTEKSPMVLPANRLQSRAWYTPNNGEYVDKGPGKIHWAVKGDSGATSKTFGEVWATYTVSLMGTNPS